jgi:hypothetical protein
MVVVKSYINIPTSFIKVLYNKETDKWAFASCCIVFLYPMFLSSDMRGRGIPARAAHAML